VAGSCLGDLFPVSPQALEAARVLVERGAVLLSAEYLGPGNLWWKPDDRPTLIGEYEIGWMTSRTDMAWWPRPDRLRKP